MAERREEKIFLWLHHVASGWGKPKHCRFFCWQQKNGNGNWQETCEKPHGKNDVLKMNIYLVEMFCCKVAAIENMFFTASEHVLRRRLGAGLLKYLKQQRRQRGPETPTKVSVMGTRRSQHTGLKTPLQPLRSRSGSGLPS